MDLSKTTLQDIDNRKSEELLSENQDLDKFFINNSSCNPISHESIKEPRGTYDLGNDFKPESYYDQKESCNETQVAINLKYKQLEHSEMQNRYTTPVTDIDVSSTMNDLSNLETNNVNNVKYGFPNITNNEFKLEASKSLNSNISDMKTVDEQLNNNKLTNTDVHKINKNVETQKGTQQELKKDKVVGDGETIEKIAEMISISNKNTNENNLKSIKKLQILMSRNCMEKHWNKCAEKSTSNYHIEKDNNPIKLSEDVTDIGKNQSLTNLINKKMECVTDLQNTSDLQNDMEISENNEQSEENCLAKSRFEEIEDKLEEMFAGIEDEQLLNTTADDTHMSRKNIQDSAEKCIKDNCHDNVNTGKEVLVDNTFIYETFTQNKTKDQTDSKIPKSLLYLKTMPPRRRLSIAMNSDLLKLSMTATDEINKDKAINNNFIRKNDMASNLIESQTHKEVKNLRKHVGKNKNNQKNGSKYKKEITYLKSNNKKKPEVSNKAKQSRQKIKQRRMQRLLSSENDNVTEERTLQTKDIDSKHRSPFILVKNNGSIAVVNTVTADDSSEKWTRSKKNCNYVYERKTVKGCHSSTLSNRYDADTADSSWICVFCKIGPHKKGLGDLFGPYIISSDCDEYRCYKNSTEELNNQQHINFSKNSITYNNEMLIPNDRHIYGFNQEDTTSSSKLGMSQISDNCFEIWIHEECAIWSPNIFVVGSRLAGLEDATWSSMRYQCAYCLKQGALLCCLQRDCKITSHIPCAREFNWILDESRFWTYCSKHVINKFNN
ncbi:uncharacterized protein CG5098 isoform X2 [Lucilia sericata]|uniref:uncharacterized protein CG5098 isoform X2 n=1 Tax=Lucilia sericata TaxID=13632 RepID=UPI0018A83186|nr:uncharacterized protein CG5098 isoform X2 [Lucilia sericata]